MLGTGALENQKKMPKIDTFLAPMRKGVLDMVGARGMIFDIGWGSNIDILVLLRARQGKLGDLMPSAQWRPWSNAILSYACEVAGVLGQGWWGDAMLFSVG